MNKNKVIGIMACDLRQVYMAQFIMNKGYLVNLICSENLAQDKKFKDIINRLIGSNTHNKLHVICDIDEFIRLSQVIVTPIPFNKISEFIIIPKFIHLLEEKEDKSMCWLYTGYIEDEFRSSLEDKKINYIDNSKCEKLTIYNSIATAEGIIAEAIINKNTNIHGSQVLVLGYGRCGKTLALKLKGLNANVSVCARREEDLAMAYSVGYNTVDLHNLIMAINKYEYIFNTIPYMILDEAMLQKVSSNSLILDIASTPGGVDKNAACKYGISVKHILGIPGKYSPKASGVALAKAFLDINI